MGNEKVTAPFTDLQVESINVYQRARVMHPFTCGREHSDYSEKVLKASREALNCPEPTCDYTQNWVYSFMADWNIAHDTWTNWFKRSIK